MISQNLPLIQFKNLFEEDQFGQKFWKYKFGPQFEKYKKQYEVMGEAGAKATPFSQIADLERPKLNQFNSVGERIDEVVYHPAHQELERLSYRQGIVANKYQSPLIDEDKAFRHQIGFSTAYYFAQTEPSLFCPICMTDALGYVLEKCEQTPEVKKAIKHIGSKDKDFWQGAMFLTEKQGGSDVGANIVRAENKNNEWLLYGDKWFCSNVDAESALVLARLPGEDGDLKHGTKGLGLFLLLRETPEKNWKNWSVNRLKEKLGVRSMASGEVTFNGAKAFLLGGFNQGFKMMAEMVNMSRLYNSVASLAVSKRALLEAKAFASQREAFGQKLTETPLWRSSYSDLFSQFVVLKALAFETIALLDRGENGDEEAKKLSRLLTPVCKALTGKFSVFSSSECMELIGGNAYIEEHILPRLLRDAQVLPIWEGTTHIQSLDVLRSIKKEGVEHLVKRLNRSLEDVKESEEKSYVEQRQKNLLGRFEESTKISPEELQRISRSLMEDLGMTLGLSLVLEMSKENSLKEISLATIKRMKAQGKFLQSPSSDYNPNLSATESSFL